jgi:DNA repair exonuclease SbcCD ATPase subunit
MYIQKITSNIKKGVEAELSPKTLIVGPNGSGKSSIINSIELALTQSVSDLRGKSLVKKGGDLITLAPKGENLTCVADYSNGKATTVTIERTDTGAGRPKVKNKINAKLPFIDVLGILTSKPEALKKWVVEQDVSAVTRPIVLELLGKEDIKERYQTLAGSAVSDEMEVIRKVQTKNSDAIKEYREEIRGIEKAIERFPSISSVSSQDEIKALQEQADRLYQTLNTRQDVSSQLHNLKLESSQKRDRLQKVVEQLAAHEKDLDTALVASNLSQPVTEQDEFIVGLRNKIIDMSKLHLAMNSQNCMVCLQGSYVDFGKRIQDLDGMNKSIEEALDYHNKRISLEKEVLRLRNTAQELVSQVQETEKQIALHDSAQTDADLTQIRDAWKESTAKVETAKASMRTLQELQKLKESIPTFQKKISTAKELDDALKSVLEKLAENSQGTFISAVQAYLPNNYKFCMSIGESVEIGFEVDGEIREALSGAEWASMIMAMSAACADSTIFNVITPEERAFDPNTLYNVMDVLTACPYQVVLTSTIKPSKDVDGWTIIELE